MNSLKSISDFYVVGINYRKTDADVRGDFAIGAEQNARLLQSAGAFGIEELFILSTCNRTEIYAVASSARLLSQFLCIETKGSLEVFEQQAYVKKGADAIQHLLKVAAGLDSQILGDYEIISQIKLSFKMAKEHQRIGLLLDKIFNSAIQSARSIRSNTRLSSGSVSVSFAAVQFIQQHYPHTQDKKILLIGVGKIGRNTCKNIVSVLGTKNINLINRTPEKALMLAQELGLHFNKDKTFEQQTKEADIILVATNAQEPTLHLHHVADCGEKLIIDLSIPYNVAPEVKDLPSVRLVNVDELSKVADETLQNRMKEVPLAEQIIQEHIQDFTNWYLMRKHVPVIRAVKSTLEEIQQKHGDTLLVEPMQCSATIQKVLNNMAHQMREKNQAGCNFISAINDFMSRS